MTEAEQRKFAKVFALLGSDQQGERQAALEVIHERGVQSGWPKFGDILQSLETTVPLVQYQQLESEVAAWIAEVDRLKRANARLNLWMAAKGMGRKLAVASVVVAVAGGGYWMLQSIGESVAQPKRLLPGDPQFAFAVITTAFSIPRDDEGKDSEPRIYEIADASYWVIRNETTDLTTYAEPSSGKPIQRFCEHYYAHAAVKDSSVSPPAWLAPSPYGLFGHVQWDEVAERCMPLAFSSQTPRTIFSPPIVFKPLDPHSDYLPRHPR